VDTLDVFFTDYRELWRVSLLNMFTMAEVLDILDEDDNIDKPICDGRGELFYSYHQLLIQIWMCICLKNSTQTPSSLNCASWTVKYFGYVNYFNPWTPVVTKR